MSTRIEYIVRVAEQVMDALQHDIVSAGEVRQIAVDVLADVVRGQECTVQVLRHLLAEGVEIGDARNMEGTYVKFIAWKGSVSDRCERAIRQAESSSEGDRGFAYWLCLREKVDEYEMA